MHSRADLFHTINYDMTEMLQPLAVNVGRCFQGYKRIDKEFRIINTETANQLTNANNIEEGLSNSDVVIQFADGQYFRDRTYRWLIDFGILTRRRLRHTLLLSNTWLT